MWLRFGGIGFVSVRPFLTVPVGSEGWQDKHETTNRISGFASEVEARVSYDGMV